MGGREVLLKAVAGAIPIYTMAVFKFPKATCTDINRAMANFWWGQRADERKIHWKGWDQLAQSKMDGGLGFKELETMNIALLAKQAWRIKEMPNAFWVRILKGLYFHNGSIMNARRGSRPSWGWVSILAGRDSISDKVFWQVYSGEDVSIWQDRWIPGEGRSLLSHPGNIQSQLPTKVSDLIDRESMSWNLEAIKDWIDDDTMDRIHRIPICENGGNDELIWPYDAKGKYTIRTGYRELMRKKEASASSFASSSHWISKALWKHIWTLDVQTKIRVFLWRACKKALPVMNDLWRRRCATYPTCVLCAAEVEDVEHMLLTCPWIAGVWYECCNGLKVYLCRLTTVDKWLKDRFNDVAKADDKGKEMKVKIALTCWFIWKGRCEASIGNKTVDLRSIINRCNKAIEEQVLILRENEAKQGSINSSTHGPEERWSPPEAGCFKANVDGAFNPIDRSAGIGVIIRDFRGELVAVFGQEVQCDNALQAEALAFKWAAKCIFELQLSGGIH